jgi:hypothetical protein
MALKEIAMTMIVALFCACGGKKEAPAPPPEPVAVEAPETKEAYPPSIRKPFLDGCIYGMAVWLGPEMANTVCVCSWEGIEEKYTLAEFVELSGKVSDDFIPQDVQDIVERCVKVNSKEASVEGDQEDPQVGPGSKYPETVRKSYHSNCVKSALDDGTSESKAKAYCSCTLEAFEAKYDIRQFLGLLSKEEADKTERFMSVIQQCLPKLTADEPKVSDSGDTARFPERLSAPFLEACMGFFKAQLGQKKAGLVCQCTLKKVEKFYSLKDFIKVIPKLDEGNFPEALEAMFVSCVAEATRP